MKPRKNKSVSRKDAKSAKKSKTPYRKARRPRSHSPWVVDSPDCGLTIIANKSMKRWLARLKKSRTMVRRLPVGLQRILDGGFKDIHGCVVYAKDIKDIRKLSFQSVNDALDTSQFYLHVHMEDGAPRSHGDLLRQLAYAIAFAQRAVALMKVQLPQYDFQVSVCIDDGSMCSTEGWPGDVVIHPEVRTDYTDNATAIMNFDQPFLQIRTR